MIDEPLISVITPTFNRADFLGQTIESVLNQSYANIEHIIIDDGSTDNTRTLVESYSHTGKVRYFYQKNSGQSVARNKGLTEAKGDFICFLDSDDYFFKTKTEVSLRVFHENPEFDLVYGDYIFVDEKGTQLDIENMTRYSGYIFKQLLKDNCVSMNTTMVRKSAIDKVGGCSENLKVADDYDLWLRLSVYSKFLYVPEKLSAYRSMENQISSNKKARFESNEEIILRFFKHNPSLLTSSEKKDALNAFYTRATRHFSSVKEFKIATSYLIKAINARPFCNRTFRTMIRIILDICKTR
ncbi:hypothetical protein A3715_07910 [Oleiphilus sp. HI0009]|nr:hypothetical protein A3715_22925 [Oleiphilus sp. HI0009]KZX80782.1 hypothetical protein A3715_07910 [Oleiphilus sp. HI0009]